MLHPASWLAPVLPLLTQALSGSCAERQDRKPLSASKSKKLVAEFLEVNGWTDAGRARLAEVAGVLALEPRPMEKWRKAIDKGWSKGPTLVKSSGRAHLCE